MSKFSIYFVIVTMAMLFYYATVIAYDLKVKKKTADDEEEEIETSDPTREEETLDEHQNIEEAEDFTESASRDCQTEENSISGSEDENMEDSTSSAPVVPEQEEEQPQEELNAFDEQEAFSEPPLVSGYEVRSIVEPTVSDKVQQHVDSVNESLIPNLTSSNSFDSIDLAKIIRDKDLRDKYNIEAYDERTQF